MQDGRVTVKGEDLRLSLSIQPFPTGSELTGTSVSIVLLNENGNEIELKEYEQGEAIIHLSVIYQRDEQNEPAAEPSKTENTLEPAASAPDQQPLQSDQQPVTPSNDALQFLTVEPDDPNMTESSEDLAKQALPEKTMEAELPAARPEPMPAVQRQLQLTANIPYCDLKIGDILILTAQITGYEGLKTHIQWQQRTKEGWLNIEGENGDTLTLLITPENFHCAWRYDVTVEQ